MKFAPFPRLPLELRLMIWRLNTSVKHIRPGGTTWIDIKIRMENPTYLPPLSRDRGRRPLNPDRPKAHVNWVWKCYPGFNVAYNRGISQANAESRAEYIRLNPDTIQLEDGPPIRFKATRDTIYLDAMSLYSLHRYVKGHTADEVAANCVGFDLVRKVDVTVSITTTWGLIPGNGAFNPLVLNIIPYRLKRARVHLIGGMDTRASVDARINAMYYAVYMRAKKNGTPPHWKVRDVLLNEFGTASAVAVTPLNPMGFGVTGPGGRPGALGSVDQFF